MRVTQMARLGLPTKVLPGGAEAQMAQLIQPPAVVVVLVKLGQIPIPVQAATAVTVFFLQ
jgi:hypothetical protein